MVINKCQIYVANFSKQSLGGGWSFISNFEKALAPSLSSYSDANVYLIPSATMLSRDEVTQAKADGKKIVLRIDNAVRDSRNRGTGMSRLRDFAQMADLVIYQSNWALNYLAPFTGKDGEVIINAVDEDIFFEDREFTPHNTFLYSRYNRDETKNFEMARFWFNKIQRSDPDAKLLLTGQYSNELRSYNFDFFMGENYEYLGVIDNPRAMAKIYNQSDYLIYSYFNDACSNTLIEALVCGCKIYSEHQMDTTGGSPEIIQKFQEQGKPYFYLDRMAREYTNAIKRIL